MNKIFFFLLSLSFTFSAFAKVVVISDLDDTVRQAHVLNKPDALRRLIIGVKPFLGLRLVFQEMSHKLKDEVEFNYLSASKDWYYDATKWLVENHFPSGKAYQRGKNDKMSGLEFKRKIVRELCEKNSDTETTFYLFGDSGENDPIVYREFMTDVCPLQTTFIFIRDVRGEAVLNGEEIGTNEKHFINSISFLHFEPINQFISESGIDILKQNVKNTADYIFEDFLDNYSDHICKKYSKRSCKKDAKIKWQDYFKNL